MPTKLHKMESMLGGDTSTPEARRHVWLTILNAPAYVSMRGHEVTLKENAGEVEAYVNGGRWVANCPNCNGGIACDPDISEGCCTDCGFVYTVAFPHPNTVRGAETVLLKREDLQNMNWLPHKEEISDLKAENASRGFDFTE